MDGAVGVLERQAEDQDVGLGHLHPVEAVGELPGRRLDLGRIAGEDARHAAFRAADPVDVENPLAGRLFDLALDFRLHPSIQHAHVIAGGRFRIVDDPMAMVGVDAARPGQADDHAHARVAAPVVGHHLAAIDHQVGLDETAVVHGDAAAAGNAEVGQLVRVVTVVAGQLAGRPKPVEDLGADKGGQLRRGVLAMRPAGADEEDVFLAHAALHQGVDDHGQHDLPGGRRPGRVIEADGHFHAGLDEVGKGRAAVGLGKGFLHRCGWIAQASRLLEAGDRHPPRDIDVDLTVAVVDRHPCFLHERNLCRGCLAGHDA